MDEDRHFLADREFSIIQTWQEWKEKWNETSDVNTLKSHLHYGLKPSGNTNEDIEKLQFYLKIADGHAETLTSYFGSSAAAELASKAFQVLCIDFFNNPFEWILVTHKELLIESLLYFFRPAEKINKTWIKNLPPREKYSENRYSSIAEKFVLSFLKNVWPQIISGMLPASDSRKVVDILLRLRRLDLLLEDPYSKPKFSDAFSGFIAIDYLKDLALSSSYISHEHVVNDDEKTLLTVEEAAALNSRPAQIYILLRNREEQFRKMKSLKDAKEALKKAEENLDSLNR